MESSLAWGLLRRNIITAVTLGRALQWVVRGARTDDVGQIAAVHEVVLHELAERRASLEDAFVALTGEGFDVAG